jgi:hypothetical protein
MKFGEALAIFRPRLPGDGSGKVICIRHELALQPGLTVFEEYPELKDGKVKLDGDNVVEFPKLT